MIKVVKIGGNVIDNEEALASFCRLFASLDGPKVLVHGGGALASDIQTGLGQTPVKIQGRRVTDLQTLKVVTMVYSGWCNKHIVSLLQSFGCNAIGLSGCDANCIVARRRPPIVPEGSDTPVDYGYVGDVSRGSVNRDFILSLIDGGMVPVFCAINHDGCGNLLNTNADTIASSMAAALGAQLLYCFERDGVLMDKDNPKSLIGHIDRSVYEDLKRRCVIADGMLPKLDNCFSALENGATQVRILNADALCDPDAGTRIEL